MIGGTKIHESDKEIEIDTPKAKREPEDGVGGVEMQMINSLLEEIQITAGDADTATRDSSDQKSDEGALLLTPNSLDDENVCYRCLWLRANGEGVIAKASRLARFTFFKGIRNKIFDNFILVVIIVNCVTMIWEKEDALLDAVEKTCTYIFIIEMLLKWFAFGLYGHYSEKQNSFCLLPWEEPYIGYFNDGWNTLDFLVVLASLPTLFGRRDSKYASLRSLRALKPLRLFSIRLKVLVGTILTSLAGLFDVILLLMFLFVVFAVGAVQLFNGVLHRRCFSRDIPLSLALTVDDWQDSWTDFIYLDVAGSEKLCSSVSDNDCVDCVSSACPDSHPYCLEIAPNPDFGATSWDNVYMAILNLFVIITLEGWVDQMYYLHDALSEYSWPFFIIVTFIISFFSVNLTLAVIEGTYDEESEKSKYIFKTMSTADPHGMDIKSGTLGEVLEVDVDSQAFALGIKEGWQILFVNEEPYSERNMTVALAEPEVIQLTFTMEGKGYGRVDEEMFAQLYPTREKRNAIKKVHKKSLVRRRSEAALRHRSIGSSASVRGLAGSKSNSVPAMDSLLDEVEDMDADEEVQLAKFEKYLQKEGNIGLGASDSTAIKYQPDALEWFQKIQETERLLFDIAYSSWRNAAPKKNPYLKDKPSVILMINEAVRSQIWMRGVMFLIVVNAVTLAIYWPGMSDDLKSNLEILNLLFTWVFFAEMCIACLGLGVHEYLASGWNRFDAVIVWLSVIEFFLGVVFDLDANGISGLRAMRSLRLLRMMKIQSMRVLITGVLNSIDEVGYLLTIFAVFLFCFAVLGQGLFSEEWEKLEPDGYYTFSEGFWWSFVTVFQVVTCDAWNGIMYEAVSVTSRYSAVYFIIVVCFGTFVLLNLFIAILLHNLSDGGHEGVMSEFAEQLALQLRKEDPDETKEKIHQVKVIIQELEFEDNDTNYTKLYRIWKRATHNKIVMIGKSFGLFDAENYFRGIVNHIIHTKFFQIGIDTCIFVNCITLAMETPNNKDEDYFVYLDYAFTTIFVIEMVMKMIAKGVFEYPFFDDHDWTKIHPRQLDSIHRDSLIHILAYSAEDISREDKDWLYHEASLDVMYQYIESDDGWSIVQYKKSEDIRVVLENNHFVTCYMLQKIPNASKAKAQIWWLYITGLFKVHSSCTKRWVPWDKRPIPERADVRKICESLRMDNKNYNSYFSSNWNLLDFLVVMVGLLGLAFDSISVLKVLRAVRPLRILTHVPQVKIVIATLIHTIPGVTSALVFSLLIYFMLAILGMYLFSNRMYDCECTDEVDEDACAAALDLVIDRATCDATFGVEWTNYWVNFDTVFGGLNVLFVAASLSGWADIMYRCVNSTGEDTLPKAYNSVVPSLYFIAAIMMCSFFCLNLFISVVLENFQRIKHTKDGSAFLTEDQRNWNLRTRLSSRVVMERNPPKPADEDGIRIHAYNIVTQIWFDPAVMACILLNIIFMALEHYNMSDTFKSFLEAADLIFVFIFAVEAVLKITAFCFPVYIKDSWNKFDFAIVLLGFVTFIPAAGVLNLNVIRIFRFARIFRLLRLLRHAKRLRVLFLTLVYSSVSLFNVGILLFVIFFIYTVVGISMFGEKGCGFQPDGESDETEAEQCADNGDKANFSKFSLGLSLLYRVATEDGWSDLYDIYLALMPGEEWVVRLFFLSFYLFGTMVLVNLFIGVILEDFEENEMLVEKEEKIESVYSWRDEWKHYDYNANGWIHANDFIETLMYAEAPAGLGLSRETERDQGEVLHMLSEYVEDLEQSASLQLLISHKESTFEFEQSGKSCCWGTDLQDVHRPSGTIQKKWMVGFDGAKLAICTKILIDEEILNRNSVRLVVQENTRTLDDWFFKEYLPSQTFQDLTSETGDTLRDGDFDAVERKTTHQPYFQQLTELNTGSQDLEGPGSDLPAA